MPPKKNQRPNKSLTPTPHSTEHDSLRNNHLLDTLAVKLEALDDYQIQRLLDNPDVGNRIVTVASQHFQGPIPPPEILTGYESIQEGLVDRIVTMAEKEQAHRHEMNILQLNSEVSKEKRGQILGGFLSLAALGVAAFITYIGHPIVGGTVATTTLGLLCTAFVLGRKYDPDKKEQSPLKN